MLGRMVSLTRSNGRLQDRIRELEAGTK